MREGVRLPPIVLLAVLAAATLASSPCTAQSQHPFPTIPTSFTVTAGNDISVELTAAGAVGLNTSGWAAPGSVLGAAEVGLYAADLITASVAPCSGTAGASKMTSSEPVCVKRAMNVSTADGGEPRVVNVVDRWAAITLADGSSALQWTIEVEAADSQGAAFRTFINASLSWGSNGGDGDEDGMVGPDVHAQWWVPRWGQQTRTHAFDDVLAMRSATDPALSLQYGQGFGDSRAGHREITPLPLAVFTAGAGAARDARGPAEETIASGVVVAVSLNDTANTHIAVLDVSPSAFRWSLAADKLAGGRADAVSFSVLVASVRGAASWRGGVARVAAAYPEFFTPRVDQVRAAAARDGSKLATQSSPVAGVGMGLYTCGGPPDINVSEVVGLSGATHNWDARFWWPYIGMALPPEDVDSWKTYLGTGETMACGAHFHHGETTTRDVIRDYYRSMAAANLTNLAYFNLFEFGTSVKWPLPAPQSPPAADDWTSSSQFVSDNFVAPSEANSSASHGDAYGGVLLLGRNSTDPSTKPTYSWAGAIVMDPGAPAWADFVVAQAQQKVDAFGVDFAGIAIDRLDWVRTYNHAADDGVSWCGGPCRYFQAQWMALSQRVSDVVHGVAAADPNGQSRLVTINYLGAHRAGLLRHVDGVYSEDGAAMNDGAQAGTNSVGLSTMGMPAMLWTYTPQELLTSPGGVDGFFQSHLYMNVQPFAPVLGGDHSIVANASLPWLQSNYTAYGPLFRALRGTTWWLQPHGVTIVPTAAPVGGGAPSASTAVANALLTRGSGVLLNSPLEVRGADATLPDVPTVVIPVVMGDKASGAVVAVSVDAVSLCSSTTPSLSCSAARPDGNPWSSITGSPVSGRWLIDVPVSRGCAVAKCTCAK